MKPLIFLFAGLAAGMFAIGCDNYLIAGLLPGIGATLKTSVAAAGQGITAFDLAYVISAPVFAVLLAGKAARIVLLTAVAVFALGNGLTLLSSNLAVYLASRAIVGIGAGLYIPIAVAAATELVGPQARGRALSLVWGANSAGAVIGVPAGLWLAGKMGWRAAIGLILAFGAIAFAGAASRQPDRRAAAEPSLAARMLPLADRRVLSVIGITLITAMASLGLYTYVAPLQSGAANSAVAAFSVWNLGGLVGGTVVGYLVDQTGRPRLVMAAILVTLAVVVATIPAVRSLSGFGLLPYFLWGAMGWATVAPQQHILLGIHPEQGATLAALNGSAIGLGSGLGSALGGFALASGFAAQNLPYAAVGLLLVAVVWQLLLLEPLLRLSKEESECPVP